jgi:hypothetical protein
MSVSLRTEIGKILFAELPDKRHEFCDYLAGRISALIGKCGNGSMAERKTISDILIKRKEMLPHNSMWVAAEIQDLFIPKPIPAEKKDEDMPSQVADTLISDEERFNLLMKLNKE